MTEIVAEVAQAHEGSLSLAHAYIDMAADAGVDAVKFQCHIAAAESTPQEPWRCPPQHDSRSRYEYWRAMEFTVAQWQGLAAHCVDQRVEFLVSPFSPDAVWLLDPLVQRWKIGSADATAPTIVEAVHRTKKPVIVSTGLASREEVGVLAVTFLDRALTILQCTSRYPTSMTDIGLSFLSELRHTYPLVRVGLSDHSGRIWPSLAAAARDADLVEVHVTFSKESKGIDTASSLDPAQLRQLCEGITAITQMRLADVSHRYDKDDLAASLAPTRVLLAQGRKVAR